MRAHQVLVQLDVEQRAAVARADTIFNAGEGDLRGHHLPLEAQVDHLRHLPCTAPTHPRRETVKRDRRRYFQRAAFIPSTRGAPPAMANTEWSIIGQGGHCTLMVREM